MLPLQLATQMDERGQSCSCSPFPGEGALGIRSSSPERSSRAPRLSPRVRWLSTPEGSPQDLQAGEQRAAAARPGLTPNRLQGPSAPPSRSQSSRLGLGSLLRCVYPPPSARVPRTPALMNVLSKNTNDNKKRWLQGRNGTRPRRAAGLAQEPWSLPHWRAPHLRGRPGLGSGGPQVPAPRRTSKAPLSTVTADPPSDGAGGWLRGPRAIRGRGGQPDSPPGRRRPRPSAGENHGARSTADAPSERFRVGTATAGGRKARRTVSPPKRRKLRPARPATVRSWAAAKAALEPGPRTPSPGSHPRTTVGRSGVWGLRDPPLPPGGRSRGSPVN